MSLNIKTALAALLLLTGVAHAETPAAPVDLSEAKLKLMDARDQLIKACATPSKSCRTLTAQTKTYAQSLKGARFSVQLWSRDLKAQKINQALIPLKGTQQAEIGAAVDQVVGEIVALPAAPSVAQIKAVGAHLEQLSVTHVEMARGLKKKVFTDQGAKAVSP